MLRFEHIELSAVSREKKLSHIALIVRLVAKPGFQKTNPGIEIHPIEIQVVDTDPSFFQDLGFQGIYMCVYIYIFLDIKICGYWKTKRKLPVSP